MNKNIFLLLFPLFFCLLLMFQFVFADKAFVKDRLDEYVITFHEKWRLTEEDIEIINITTRIYNMKSKAACHGKVIAFVWNYSRMELNVSCGDGWISDKILIRANEVIVHELAHYLYAVRDPYIKRFELIFRGSEESIEKSAYVSEYAKTDIREDYAETFRVWYMDYSESGVDEDVKKANPKLAYMELVYGKWLLRNYFTERDITGIP